MSHQDQTVGAGTWISAISLAALVIALFIPAVTSDRYAIVVNNRLIDTSNGTIYLMLAVFAALAITEAHSDRRRYAGIGPILLGTGFAVLALQALTDDSVRSLTSIGGAGALGGSGHTIGETGPGLVLFLAGAIGIAVGGFVTLDKSLSRRPSKKPDEE